MENGWVTWLIVVGLVALQFVGSNKKRKAAEARKRAIIEERMRQAARQDYGYDTELDDELEEIGEENDYLTASEMGKRYSEDPFDFLNMSKLAERVEQVVQEATSQFDYSAPEESTVIVEDRSEDRYYDSNIEFAAAIEEFAAEGVRSTVDDDPDAIGGVNDEAGLYINEEELTSVENPVIASFDPKLFILYSEIARPKYQD